MTKKDEKLLLKDLSARLSYGVKAQVKINVEYSDAHKPNSKTWVGDIWGITTNEPYTAWVYSMITIYPCGPEQNLCSISECKPYLRPMSSMTEEERKYYIHLLNLAKSDRIVTSKGGLGTSGTGDIIDYLISHHFDYRGLIPMGLALEAPEVMYKNK